MNLSSLNFWKITNKNRFLTFLWTWLIMLKKEWHQTQDETGGGDRCPSLFNFFVTHSHFKDVLTLQARIKTYEQSIFDGYFSKVEWRVEDIHPPLFTLFYNNLDNYFYQNYVAYTTGVQGSKSIMFLIVMDFNIVSQFQDDRKVFVNWPLGWKLLWRNSMILQEVPT